ncbi:MAG: MBL fold metallo-hydrolase [Coriobacteriia bacterium]|nr:MBL fold metallo-hydrolase [Coriobacteriia bacterium]
MRIQRLALGPLETNCWIVGDDAGSPVFVIDPGGEAQVVLEAVGDRGVHAILLTHGHFDHIGGVTELADLTKAPLAAHPLDALDAQSPRTNGGAEFGFHHSCPQAAMLLEDGALLVSGGLQLRVLHTPGHTPGGICLLATDSGPEIHLFSGDTLFAGSVGRTDFPGGSARDLATSIAQSLAVLPPETTVHPGHGPDTTIAHESKVNFFWPR